MGSLENNFVYALMGMLNLMLFPYITSVEFSLFETINKFGLKIAYQRSGKPSTNMLWLLSMSKIKR